MPRPATTQDATAFRIAKDECTRYENYLGLYAERFMDEGTPTTDPAEFARHAFTIATGPIMSPGYVLWHPRVTNINWHGDDHDRGAIELGLVVPMPPAIAKVVSTTPVHGWEHSYRGSWYPPENNDRPSVFATLTCRVPLDPARLPAPRYTTGGAPQTLTAVHAVAGVCAMVNEFVAPILTVLEA